MAERASETKPPEFEPPMACVQRVIKAVLPENVQVTKEAKAAFARAAGIFIFYLTHCANDFTRENKRTTIYPSDIIDALRELDFEEFVAPLENFLRQHKAETESKKKSKAAGSAGASGGAAAEGEEAADTNEGGDDQDEEDL